MKKCIIVLGMHRSGTSALTGIISILGFNPGADLMNASKDNPKGYFENNKIYKLNDKVLRENDATWDDCLFEYKDIKEENIPLYISEAKEILLTESDDAITLIKDPRICILFPIWERALKELNYDINIIVIHRPPKEVALSLKKRNDFTTLKSCNLWAHYFFQLEEHTRLHKRLLVNYEKYDIESLDKLLYVLGDFTGVKITKDIKLQARNFYSPSLKHHTLTLNPDENDIYSNISNLILSSKLIDLDKLLALKKKFYKSNNYINLYKEKKITLLDELTTEKRKNATLSEKNEKEILLLKQELHNKNTKFYQFKDQVNEILKINSTKLLELENQITIAEDLVHRIATDNVFTQKIRNNFNGYPIFSTKTLLNFFKNKHKKNIQRDKSLIAKSGLFSPFYYLTHNKDIWKHGYDPLDSYCKTGWKECRKPNETFDPEYYRHTNHNVPKNINPLIHYLMTGKSQGYIFQDNDAFLLKNIPSENFEQSGFPCKKQILNTEQIEIPQIKLTNDILVSIIIVNKDGIKYLKTLLPLIYAHTKDINYELILVDNQSEDASTEYFENSGINFNYQIIRNNTNESFSKANNIAAKIANGSYLVLLNNDVEPTKGWLNFLLKEILNNGDIGSVGAKLLYPHKDTYTKSCKIQHTGISFIDSGGLFRAYNIDNGANPDDSETNTSWNRAALTAACLLISKKVYFKIGGLDENYIYGYEDVDLGLKLIKEGYKNRFCSNAILFHHEFGTQDKQEINAVKSRRINNRNILNKKWYSYLKKNYWIEKLNSKPLLFSGQKLTVGVIPEPEVNITSYNKQFLKSFKKQLSDWDWNVVLLENKNPYPAHIDEEVDILFNLTNRFNLATITRRDKRLIKVAFIIDQADIWFAKGQITEYDLIFVFNKSDYKLLRHKYENIELSLITDNTPFSNFYSESKPNQFDEQIDHNENQAPNYINSIYFSLSHRLTKTSIAIKIPAPNWQTIQPWGDYHIAVLLKNQLEKLGYRVICQILPEWYNKDAEECDVALVLRGLRKYNVMQHQLNIMWNISHPDMVDIDEYSEYDSILIASDYWAKKIKEKDNALNVRAFLQCTDPDRFRFPNNPKTNHGLLFVGNSRGVYRNIVKDAITMSLNPEIYGEGWEDIVPNEFIKGTHIKNSELYKYYGSSNILLNDHWDDMKDKGFISNRIFDGLASGAFIISDKVKNIGSLNDYIVSYESAQELKEKIEYYLQNPEERKKLKIRAREYILKNHTFKHRAIELDIIITNLLNNQEYKGMTQAE